MQHKPPLRLVLPPGKYHKTDTTICCIYPLKKFLNSDRDPDCCQNQSPVVTF